MDRTAWLQERRRVNEQRMDTLFAPIYDQHWGSYINPTHATMLECFLLFCPPGATILEAGCGTGKYWPAIIASGRSIAGIDQSQGMLDIARAKFPDVPVRKLGLQELYDQAEYDGIMCVDVMENIFPEDWPLVLQNFHRALRSPGYLYLTVELETPEALAHAMKAGRELRLPLIEGEVAHEGSYHYYPRLEQVHDWMRQAGFSIVETAEGDGYYHILVCR